MVGSSTSAGPLVSVVTAAYCAREALERTIASVAEQSFRDTEHIVIDGGSDDGTRQMLETAGDSVRWVSEPDEGIADALNKGVAMARGEYVLVLQAGDRFVDAASLERAAPLLQARYDIVSYDVILMEAEGERMLRSRGFGGRFDFFMSMPHQGAFCRRELIARCGGFDPQFSVTMDYDFYFRARAAGARVQVVSEALAVMPDGGISTRTDWPSVRLRLAEARRLHFRFARSRRETAKYAAFWSLYWPYKRMRNLLSR